MASALTGSGFARGVLHQLVIFLEDVAPVVDLLDLENLAQQARHINGPLVRDDVSELVRQHARQLVFAAREGDQFARHVDTSAR